MASQYHLTLLKQNIVSWNEWRKNHPDIRPDLSGANLSETHLEGADLSEAHLNMANLTRAHLERVNLFRAELKSARLIEANLENANLNEAILDEANLSRAQLNNAQLIGTQLKKASLLSANLRDADFTDAQMQGAYLIEAELFGAILSRTNLENANLFEAHLENARLNETHLEKAYLKGAYLDGARLEKIILGDEKHIGSWLADIHWGNTNLASVNWSQVKILGEEEDVFQKERNGKLKDKNTRLDEYEVAIRTNRQVAIVLQSQGLSEYAAYFAYRAQKLQKALFRKKHRFAQYFFYTFLDSLAGYGYKPQRSLYWYLVIIFGFAIVYYFLAQTMNVHLSYLGSLVFSITSFHGRGFSPGLGANNLDNPLLLLAAIEGIMGLAIEVSFIATFTQRFFGK